MNDIPSFFWLHIKKSAGQSTRLLLAPDYVEVDRSKRPMTFVGVKPEQYMDTLNNFRIPLGDYQFRRALFAKTFLYPQSWDQISSFAFSREPVRRCVSAFFNLSRDIAKQKTSRITYPVYALARRTFPRHREFDRFLNWIEETRESQSNYLPHGLSFSTHTATMWGDVTDAEGQIILRHIFRLEDMISGINLVFEECGLARRVDPLAKNANANRRAETFTPLPRQRARIEELYAEDFEIHEGRCHRFAKS